MSFLSSSSFCSLRDFQSFDYGGGASAYGAAPYGGASFSAAPAYDTRTAYGNDAYMSQAGAPGFEDEPPLLEGIQRMDFFGSGFSQFSPYVSHRLQV